MTADACPVHLNPRGLERTPKTDPGRRRVPGRFRIEHKSQDETKTALLPYAPPADKRIDQIHRLINVSPDELLSQSEH